MKHPSKLIITFAIFGFILCFCIGIYDYVKAIKYTFKEIETLMAFNLNGEPLWSHRLSVNIGKYFKMVHYIASCAIDDNGNIYSLLYKPNISLRKIRQSGEIEWTQRLDILNNWYARLVGLV
jgi:hypothetical protein